MTHIEIWSTADTRAHYLVYVAEGTYNLQIMEAFIRLHRDRDDGPRGYYRLKDNDIELLIALYHDLLAERYEGMDIELTNSLADAMTTPAHGEITAQSIYLMLVQLKATMGFGGRYVLYYDLRR